MEAGTPFRCEVLSRGEEEDDEVGTFLESFLTGRNRTGWRSLIARLTMCGSNDIRYTWGLRDVLELDIEDAEWYAEQREEENRKLAASYQK